jgi:hypothetical protein
MYINKTESDLIAIALRNYAKMICDNPDDFSIEECKSLDRALRCCPSISDIDVVWVRWGYLSTFKDITTNQEIITTKSGRRTYPEEQT